MGMTYDTGMNTPFFVAEISSNHSKKLDHARELVRLAADSGANAVKFQTFTADTMVPKTISTKIDSKHPLWGDKDLYELYEEAQTPWEWHEELFELARSLDVIPFSSPFSIEAVDFLESINCEMYKVASLEIGDKLLLERIALTGKPVIASTGAATLEEIDGMVKNLKLFGVKDLTLLLCTSSYPTSLDEVNLNRIFFLSERYGVPIGLSDHTTGISSAVFAAALGAKIIEKHLTESRQTKSLDSEFSLIPEEFKEMIQLCKEGIRALGEYNWSIQPGELFSRNLRRSLFVTRDILAGEELDLSSIRAFRPNIGIKADELDLVIGKKVNRNLKAFEPIYWEDISE